ncbi:MAG: hypothetical protein PHF21_03145 [Bacilli bacterium]|nr:hypothetical protein [Bacilli bacterium]
MYNEEKFNRDFLALFNLEDVAYYYHVTEKDMYEIIFNEGLIMQEKELFTKMIPIDEEIINDPLHFVTDEKNRGINITTGSIILIGILKEELDYAVRKNIKNSKHWNEETLPEYVLDSQYIIGSIDIDNLELTLNENYLLAADLDFESQHKLY